jgi:manganese transport protein
MGEAKKQKEDQKDLHSSAAPSATSGSDASYSSSPIQKNSALYAGPRLNLVHFLKFMGIGVVVGVAYIDPGNWGTDIAAGSKFGYSLLWVVVMSNLMGMLL